MLAAAGQKTGQAAGGAAQNGQRDSTGRAGGNVTPGQGGFGGRTGQGGTGARAGGQQRSSGSTGVATLWTLGADGKTVKPVRVRTGLTDGQRTAITTNNAALTEGTQVIIGVTGEAATATTTSATNSNPFQPQRGPGGPRGF
jgi:hypothetical protein